MYICDGCGVISKPGEPSNSWVSQKRKRNYELLGKEKERIGVVSGWEIKKEVKLCSSCFAETRKTEECRGQVNES